MWSPIKLTNIFLKYDGVTQADLACTEETQYQGIWAYQLWDETRYHFACIGKHNDAAKTWSWSISTSQTTSHQVYSMARHKMHRWQLSFWERLATCFCHRIHTVTALCAAVLIVYCLVWAEGGTAASTNRRFFAVGVQHDRVADKL